MSPRLWAAGTWDGSVYSPAHPQGRKKGLSGEGRGWGGRGAGADLEVSPHPTWQEMMVEEDGGTLGWARDRDP